MYLDWKGSSRDFADAFSIADIFPSQPRNMGLVDICIICNAVFPDRHERLYRTLGRKRHLLLRATARFFVPIVYVLYEFWRILDLLCTRQKSLLSIHKVPASSGTIPFPGQLHTRWQSHRQTRPEWHLLLRSSDNPDCSESCSVRRPSAYHSRA